MINNFKGLVEACDQKNYSKDVYNDFVLNYNYITESLKSKKIKINIDSEGLHKNRLDKSNSFIVLFVGSCFYLFFLVFVILHFIISGFSDFIYSLFDWELQKIPFAYLIFLGLGFLVSVGGYKRRSDYIRSLTSEILKAVNTRDVSKGMFRVFELYNKKCLSFYISGKKIIYPDLFSDIIKK